jgi:hypothetical protein
MTTRNGSASHTDGSPRLDVGGCSIALAVRRSRRSRRLYLRVDPVKAQVELILPRGVALEAGLRFAHERHAWLSATLAAIPARTQFCDGAALPLLGETITIRHRPDAAGPVRRDGADLLVAGAPEHIARRVREWLRREARRELWARSCAAAERVGKCVVRVRIGDPKSRWGSCSRKGGLAYSWRLILAPLHVLDYVVAHEVAHLVEPNHGPRFWRQVRSLGADVIGAKAWLHRHGNALLRFG